MRSAFGIMLSCAVLALAVGCGKKDSTTASGGGGGGGGGSGSIEGTYLIAGMEAGGEKIPNEFFTKGPEEERIVKITADKMIGKKGGKDDPSTYKTDASKTPAHIDMVGKGFDGKDEKVYGIYKLEGETLTICVVESDKAEDRPKEFKTEKGKKAMIMTLTKKK